MFHDFDFDVGKTFLNFILCSVANVKGITVEFRCCTINSITNMTVIDSVTSGIV